MSEKSDEELRGIYKRYWGRSHAAFCREHNNIDPSHFSKWRRGLETSPASKEAVENFASKIAGSTPTKQGNAHSTPLASIPLGQSGTSQGSSSATKTLTMRTIPSNPAPTFAPGSQLMTVAAINADGSNRHPSINNIPALGEKIISLNSHQLKASLLTISEARSTLEKELTGLQPYKYNFGGDFILTAYDPAVWEMTRGQNGAVQHIFSYYGRYQALILENKLSKKTVCYTSVHLPHKSGKKIARDLLLNFYEKKAPDVDAFMIGGDFNATPEILISTFDQLSLTFNNDDGATTNKGGKKDNVLFNDGFSLQTKKILHSDKTFSHFPIQATFEFAE